MKDNLVLIGMMGSGKSTVGRLLAEKLGRRFVDTDSLIEERCGCPIPRLVEERGWDFFRDEELGLSEELARERDLVIACGGGLPMRPDCIGSLKFSGTVLWLRRDPEETYDRLDRSHRPLAQQGKAAFLELYAQREPVYREWAEVVIPVGPTPQDTLNAILEVLE